MERHHNTTYASSRERQHACPTSTDYVGYKPYNNRYDAKRDQSLAQSLNEENRISLSSSRSFTDALSIENDSRLGEMVALFHRLISSFDIRVHILFTCFALGCTVAGVIITDDIAL